MSNRNMSTGLMQVTSPNWLADFRGRDQLMPGGFRLDATLFVAYPGPVKVNVGTIGSAAAAVPKAGNTGNATVGSLAARIGTQTETLTITFLTATTFTVTGSKSGAQANGTTGVAYTAGGVANFTITAGGTPMVAGDGFTIALTKGTTGAAIGAVTIPVGALSAAIPAGYSLNFGAGKFAVLATTAAAAAESLTVLPIDQAINAGDFATFSGWKTKTVPSGTFVSRTFAQRAAGLPLHPAVASEDEYYLTAFDVLDAAVNDEVTCLRPNEAVVKENFLPGWQGLSGALQTQLRATYKTTLGAE